jgi:hypothetical protein
MKNNNFGRWLPLGDAGRYLGVSRDTILRRSTPFDPKNPDGWVQYKVRWKYLELGEGTRRNRRYLLDDLERMLVPA